MPVPLEIARINEVRSAVAVGEMADEHAALADGWLNYTDGVKWANCATAVGLTADVSDEDLDALEAFYIQRNEPPAIELTIFADENLLKKLGTRGFRVDHFENVMARPLNMEALGGSGARARGGGAIAGGGGGDDLCGLVSGRLSAGLSIKETRKDDLQRVIQQATLVSNGFRPDDQEPDEKNIKLMQKAIEHERSTSFMAYIDSQPVGGCSMEIFTINNTRACSFWGTSVEKPFQKRGIQQALIAKRLAFGISQGCTLAIIESKPGIPTERNAARMGFTLSYVRMRLAKPLS